MIDDNNIGITVQTQFLREQGDPEKNRFAFAYHITISNYGKEPARLLSRHWIITDANGHVDEVMGEGVVGEQPLIPPGRSYQYTSGAILSTPVGSMHGSYTFVNHKGDYFDTAIPAFRLAVPELVN